MTILATLPPPINLYTQCFQIKFTERMSCNHEYQRLLSNSSKSAPVSSSSYGTLDKEGKVGRQNSKTVQCISKKIRRQFSVILVAVLIFMVKDGALGVDKVLDTLEQREILDVKKEEASNSLNANEDPDPSETLSDEQIEALFLAFGFSLSVVLLAVSNTTVICLLGTLAAVSSTSMTLLILNFDYFLSMKGK